LGYTKVTKDLTERKRAEESLRSSEENLRKLNHELEAFSYSISHDLRAPLRAMDGFSRALTELYEDKLDDRGRDYLKRIRESSVRMGHLIDDLLSLSRIGRAEIHKSTVNLSELASEIIEELKQNDRDRDVAFLITPGISATADPTLLRLVLENLLNNAWKYTSKHKTAKIEFSAKNQDGKTVYFVRDDGAGFEMQYVESYLEPFKDSTASGNFRGQESGW
jgi:light-regulated signal transduction histidine kinase (bacteriophytochrome)